MASSIFLNPAFGVAVSGGSVTFTTPALFADGTALLPGMAFFSEPTLGLWRSAAGQITVQGALVVQGGATGITSTTTIDAGTVIGLGTGLSQLRAPAARTFSLSDFTNAIGVRLKFDALPTIGSGFGSGAAVTAGSTPLAGSVAVGTTAGASGVITFNGTAFPSAPYPICMNQTTGLAVKATASTTQLTIGTATGNFADNDVISWICISSK